MKPMYKIAAAFLGLALLISVAKSFAASSSNNLFDGSCAVDVGRQEKADGVEQDNSTAILRCANGEAFEVKRIMPNVGGLLSSSSCRSSHDCNGGEFCDQFHQCQPNGNPDPRCANAGEECFTSLDCCNPGASCVDSACNR